MDRLRIHRLAPGAPVVLTLTRWNEDDLAGRLLAAEDEHLWRVLNITAQAGRDPDAGQVDPLGREPGEFMVSARGRTTRQWEAIRVRVGSRTWQALYQGRPSPPEGGMLARDAWRHGADRRQQGRHDYRPDSSWRGISEGFTAADGESDEGRHTTASPPPDETSP